LNQLKTSSNIDFSTFAFPNAENTELFEIVKPSISFLSDSFRSIVPPNFIVDFSFSMSNFLSKKVAG